MGKEKIVKQTRSVKLFNAPAEVGLRGLILLNSFDSELLDFQRILYLDYLIVNSGDVENGPTSLHANVPFRSSAISVRRKDLQDGLNLLVTKELVSKHFVPDKGLFYSATDLAPIFLKYFKSEYFLELSERARWVRSAFGKMDTSAISDFFNKNLGPWNSEFSRESLTRSDWQTNNVD